MSRGAGGGREVTQGGGEQGGGGERSDTRGGGEPGGGEK